MPTGILTTACTSVYGIASTFYLPRLLETYSRRYGLLGVTLAPIGWLLAISLIVVATTASSEFDRAREPWARRIQERLRIEPARTRPLEGELLAQPAPRPAAPGRPHPAAPTPAEPAGGTSQRGRPADRSL